MNVEKVETFTLLPKQVSLSRPGCHDSLAIFVLLSPAQFRPVAPPPSKGQSRGLTEQDNPANGKEDPGQPDARPVGLACGSKGAKLITLTEWRMGCRECGSRAPPRGPHTVNGGGSHRARKGRSSMRVLACHVLGLDDFLDM